MNFVKIAIKKTQNINFNTFLKKKTPVIIIQYLIVFNNCKKRKKRLVRKLILTSF